jgi:hypothetical protein
VRLQRALRCIPIFAALMRWKRNAGALVMPLMQQGLRRGLIKFNLMTCVKA